MKTRITKKAVHFALPEEGEWVRFPKPGETLCGLTKGTLYYLYQGGLVLTVSLPRPGATRGPRLIHLPSLQKYLARLFEDQNGVRPDE
jgi:hypothetical protein